MTSYGRKIMVIGPISIIFYFLEDLGFYFAYVYFLNC